MGKGWGIHLVEDFWHTRNLLHYEAFHYHKYDLWCRLGTERRRRGAFGDAAYICALSTFRIGCCIAYLEYVNILKNETQ